jgi:hypothetical protein
MQKALLLFLVVLITNVGNGQSEKFTIDFKIKSFSYKGESVVFDQPSLVTMNTNGCTEIVTLGTTKSYEFGVKLEILKSDFYEPNSYVVAKAFYVKSGNEWQEISKFNHASRSVESISERQSKKSDGIGYGSYSVGDPKYFEIELKEYYYYSN